MARRAKLPTINDVARTAGVSKKTVSRVLNRSTMLRQDTRERVQAVIAELGYVPNPQARALALRHNFLIGLLHDNPNAQTVLNIQEGVLDAIRDTDFALVVRPVDRHSPDMLEDIRRFLEKQRLYGALILPPISENEELAELCRSLGCGGRGGRSLRPARYPGQQRRDHPPRRFARFHRGGLGRGARHQPQGAVLPLPGRRAPHGRLGQPDERARQDRQYRLAAELSGRHPRAQLHRQQERVGGLTMLLANEWAAKGINVNAIAPGYIATNNTAALQADETRNRQILERVPEGRWGEPEDIGGAAVFLASKAADYVQGQILAVDGGGMGR